MVSGWGSSHSHLHPPRRSHDQNDGDSKHSRSSSPDSELPTRRSSSDATPRQTPATTRFLSNDHESTRNQDNRTQENRSQDVSSSSKRLGFFADKLSSSFAGSGTAHSKSSLHPSQLLHPLSHTRSDSTVASSLTLTPMAAPSSIPNVVKSHSSPSKVPTGQINQFFFYSYHHHRHHMVVPMTQNWSHARCIVSVIWPIYLQHLLLQYPQHPLYLRLTFLLLDLKSIWHRVQQQIRGKPCTSTYCLSSMGSRSESRCMLLCFYYSLNYS